MRLPDITETQVVNAPLEALWESWADFGGIYKFHADVSRTTILSVGITNGPGAVRRCELADGKNKIDERITEWVPMQKISVEFVQTTLPISQARATFVFKSHGALRSEVEMRFSFTPKRGLLRLIKPLMRRKMRTGFVRLLQNNKAYVEEMA